MRVPDSGYYEADEAVSPCWDRLDPPTHWPDGTRSNFQRMFRQRSFESQLPAWKANFGYYLDRYGTIVLSLETRHFGEQILDYNAHRIPFRLGEPRFDKQR